MVHRHGKGFNMSIATFLGVPGKLKTLLGRLTSTRATNLDYLDAAVTSRAAASTALSSATWTSTRAGYIDRLDAAISTIPTSPINLIQRGQTDPTTTTTDVTITAVDMAKTVIHLLTDSGLGFTSGAAVYLTSTTNLRIIVGNAGGTSVVSWEVVEYV